VFIVLFNATIYFISVEHLNSFEATEGTMSGEQVTPANSRFSRKNSSSRLVKQFAEMNIEGEDIIDRGESAKSENRFVFECAWEVANKGYYFQ
jgi:hypothetical protein